MTQQHPITPPPDKIHNWLQLVKIGCDIEQVLISAAQWGADTELKACCEALKAHGGQQLAEHFRVIRRPKPPSLKKQALDQLDGIAGVFRMSHGGDLVCDKIRCALESIPDPS
jgi:hypothetical protein